MNKAEVASQACRTSRISCILTTRPSEHNVLYMLKIQEWTVTLKTDDPVLYIKVRSPQTVVSTISKLVLCPFKNFNSIFTEATWETKHNHHLIAGKEPEKVKYLEGKY